MLILNAISGADISTPAAGTSNLYLTPSGQLALKRPSGVSSFMTKQQLQTIPDVVGVFSSGNCPVYDGTNWRPTTATAAIALSTTIYSSGEVYIQTLIESGIIPDGGTPSTIVFSGLSLTPFDWLEIRGVTRANVAAGKVSMYLFYNGDTTVGNYYYRALNNDAGTFGSVGAATPIIGETCGQTNQNSNFGDNNPFRIHIPTPTNTNLKKWAFSVGPNPSFNTGATMNASTYTSVWKNNAAIDMIELRVVNADTTFCSGTRVYLYGHSRQWVVQSGSLPDGPGISHGFLTP